ncbi:MAG: LysR family transcriptional regulator [Rhodobacteraceae bacterium]|nr:LysR family transcriptional regulator [Paracoccaceae bacterium]MAY45856.1 LysR family transcriptional regulator [Paracoccaceae bacterium]QEW23383.1 Gcv operon activator [Paracoccaceae bacterium]
MGCYKDCPIMHLRSRLPSTGALFVFEAAARNLNFSDASREFNVTQPAVSKTIRQLEETLGVKLFARTASGVDLTPSGKILFEAVSSGFRQVELALNEIERLRDDPVAVTISVTSSFAIHWFMPRMDRFRMALPDIPIRFQIQHSEATGPLDGALLGVRREDPADQDFDRTYLTDERIVAVASPAYIAAHGRLDQGTTLKGHTLGYLYEQPRVPWDTYLRDSGCPPPQDAGRMTFSDYALLLQAVIKGQCVGLGWRYIISHELEQKGLVPAAGRDHVTGLKYYVVTPKGRPVADEVAQVRDWLIDEINSDSMGLAR